MVGSGVASRPSFVQLFIPWSYFDVEIALNNVDIQLSFRWCEEYALIDFELSSRLDSTAGMVIDLQLTFSVPVPNSCLSVQAIRVFFPAPLGP
jgi:hypothetical protein